MLFYAIAVLLIAWVSDDGFISARTADCSGTIDELDYWRHGDRFSFHDAPGRGSS